MKWLILIASLLVSALAWSQPEFEVTTSSDRMMIGDQVEIQIQAKVHVNDEVYWPAFPGKVQFGTFIDRKGIDTVKRGDELTLTETWILTSFDSGFAVVSPLELTVNGVIKAAEPQLIQVDLAENGPEYLDIENPITPGSNTFWIWLIVVVVILAAVAVFIYSYFVKEKPEEKPRFSNLHKPSDVITTLIEEEKIKIQESSDQLDSSLSDSTKLIYEYIKIQFEINTAHGSTEQWDQQISLMGNNSVQKGELTDILNEISRLRFSGADVSEGEAIDVLNKAITWIKISSEVQPKTLENELV